MRAARHDSASPTHTEQATSTVNAGKSNIRRSRAFCRHDIDIPRGLVESVQCWLSSVISCPKSARLWPITPSAGPTSPTLGHIRPLRLAEVVQTRSAKKTSTRTNPKSAHIGGFQRRMRLGLGGIGRIGAEPPATCRPQLGMPYKSALHL